MLKTFLSSGDNIAVEGSFSNILLQPTNSQMLEKANAAARRRRQSLTTDIPRPTRFLLDDAEEVAGTGQPYFGAAFHDEDAPYLKDSPAQNRGLFLPVLKSSLPSNSRLEALTNNLGKLDCSITNISSIDSCHLFNSKTVSSNDRSSNACSYAETSELREESEINFCSPLITSCVTSSLGDRVQSSNFPPSVERKSGCKQSSDNLNLPNKKVKLENTKRDVPRAAIPNAIEDNSNQISSQAIQQDTRVLLTSSSNLTDGKQALFDSGKIVNVGFQFPRGEIKNSLNCYEIKPRDDLSFEVVPSSVAWKGKAHVLPQNHMNETELNNHAKIITEVLKKFPNLIKDKKNVKLKIMKQELDKNLSNSTTQAESSSSNSVISAKSRESARSITFRCFKCLQLFATHFSLKKHVLNSHEDPAEVLRQSGSKLHACWRCSGQSRCFDSYVQLQRHLREAHRSEQLQCGECSYRSSKNVDLAFHKFKEHGTLPNNFHFPKCKMCNFVGRSASDLERHCASKHSTDSYACSSCDVSFRSLGALQGHVQAKVCQNKPGASFTCPHCSETFSKSYNLKAHLRSRHKNLKFKRAEATSSGRVNENISFVHTSESHPDQDARETTVEHKQASGCTVPSYLPFENKISFDASDDIQVDNSCTSSSFIVSTLKPNEAYGINSDSDFIEIVGSCTDVGASYATRPLTLGTILDVMPSTSSGYVPSCTVSADAVWTCLSSDASVASVPSSAMKDPMTE
ncbi:Zinc finger C2H2-type [Trinorchestia longiramus]|nr:Zinc finger C2H2-type [Trinorchestia longiramus]